jgi:hypothetical protein
MSILVAFILGSVHFQLLGIKMSPNLKRLLTVADKRLAAIADTKTNLKTRFLELTRLREQVGKAHLLANPRNKTRGRSPRQFGNNEARL